MAVSNRLHSWAQRASERPLRHLPPEEQVVIDERQHPAVLIVPAIRTGSGVGMLISRPTIGLVLLFAGAVLLGTIRSPSWLKRQYALMLVALLSVGVYLLAHAGPLARALTALGIVLWLGNDVLDWFADRLVVTDRRLYRIYGVLITHRPSIALQTITVVDLELGPAGRWFGTLSFDTPAQRDGPLHHFRYIRQAGAIHVTILQLRAAATSSAPPPPV